MKSLDYFFVSEGLCDLIEDAKIYVNERGSDHAPVMLEIDMSKPVANREDLARLTYTDLRRKEDQHIYYYSILGKKCIGKTGKNVNETIEDGRYDLTLAWESIDWDSAETHLQKMQGALAKAAYSYDMGKIKKWQFKIVTSLDAKLLAVRDVTARKAEVGVDHIK